jgi:HEAT repeat protein
MPFKFPCPSCEIALAADEENIGRIGRCPKCKQKFEVALSLARPAPQEGHAPSSLYSDLLRTDSVSGKQVWFESYDRGANYYRELKLLRYTDFLALTFEERQRVFTVPGVNDLKTVGTIHKLVLLDFDGAHGGSSFRGFSKKVKELFGGTLPFPIAKAKLEWVYRRSMARIYSRGLEQSLENGGLNSDAFPYRLFTAVGDARTPPSHLALENSGLNGTAIYRWNDPFLQCCMPPITDMCRCGTICISIEDAAAKGVEEARKWQRTGTPPNRPHWVKWPEIDPRWELEDEEFTEDDIPDLILQAQHKDPVIRGGVFWALKNVTICCELDDPALAESLGSILNGALHEPNGFIRKAAAEALANLAETRLESRNRTAEVQSAIGMLCDTDREKRVAAAQTLATIGAGDELTIPALITALRDDDAQVRSKAAYALGEMRADAVTGVPGLVVLLDDSRAYVRQSALWALYKIGPSAKDAVPAVLKRLNDPAKTVREAAAAVVRLLNPEAAGGRG